MSFNLTNLTGSYALNGNGDLIVGGSITTGSGGVQSFTGGESLKGFKSGTLNITASSVDNSARGDGGWAVNSPGSRTATLEVTFNRIISDTTQQSLIDLFTASDTDFKTKGVAIAYKTSDGATTKTIYGVFVPTDLSQNQTGGGDADGTAEEVSITFASWSPLSKDSTTNSGGGSSS